MSYDIYGLHIIVKSVTKNSAFQTDFEGFMSKDHTTLYTRLNRVCALSTYHFKVGYYMNTPVPLISICEISLCLSVSAIYPGQVY